MKNKFSIFNFKLFSYLKQLFTNENPDSKSAVKKKQVVVENHLRWEDDGGPAVDADHHIPQVAETQPPQKKDEKRKHLL